jgi:ribosomal protein L29
MAKKIDYTNEKEANLHKEIAKLREEIRSSRADLNGQTQGNTARVARRNVARIQTELSTRAKSIGA